jgi:D-ornithine 4,5-aminomutase subunit alpha
MRCVERADDFASRRARLQALPDEELHAYFWSLTDKLVAPLIAEAQTHTSPSIERSVLLRMGFSSPEAKTLVDRMGARGLLAHGVGRQLLELAKAKKISVRAAGIALLAGEYWEKLPL